MHDFSVPRRQSSAFPTECSFAKFVFALIQRNRHGTGKRLGAVVTNSEEIAVLSARKQGWDWHLLYDEAGDLYRPQLPALCFCLGSPLPVQFSFLLSFGQSGR